ncbi:putative ras-related GTP-binding protein [Trypanosoma grayi]|uniref:putative ras-related GTP-binding protein n=1 Tax=Trypanosoma grayi TaxID=71804 RepID=UPI0004F488E4|nr:putative ras-related GTP-binding protein [Trypanosoma grayi]KEG07865.1 putative ras-related GTP-binding protein [Trypanosoma grayi]
MAPMYFRHAAGALLVFDEISLESFGELETVWLPELLPHMNNSTEFIVVCGNKCDAVTKAEQTESVLQAQETCSAKGLTFLHTSAKNGQNVHEAFEGLVDRILTKRGKEAAASPAASNGGAKASHSTRLGSNGFNDGNNAKEGCC